MPKDFYSCQINYFLYESGLQLSSCRCFQFVLVQNLVKEKRRQIKKRKTLIRKCVMRKNIISRKHTLLECPTPFVCDKLFFHSDSFLPHGSKRKIWQKILPLKIDFSASLLTDCGDSYYYEDFFPIHYTILSVLCDFVFSDILRCFIEIVVKSTMCQN